MSDRSWNYDLTEVPKGHYVEAANVVLQACTLFCDWQGGFHRVSDGRRIKMSTLVAWRPLPVADNGAGQRATKHEPAKLVPRRKGEGYHGFTL